MNTDFKSRVIFILLSICFLHSAILFGQKDTEIKAPKETRQPAATTINAQTQISIRPSESKKEEFFEGQTESKIATKQDANRLLKSIMDGDEVNLLVVEKTYIAELKRINSVIDQRGPGSSHYNYLLKEREDIEKEKIAQELFQMELREAMKEVAKIDHVYYLADTSWNNCIANRTCTVIDAEKNKKSVNIDQGKFFFIANSTHPSTRKRGMYFYTTDKKYLDDPFIDYLPSHRTIDAIFNALDPSKDSRVDPYFLVEKLNKKLTKKLQQMAQFYAKQREE